jgi:hypothetical protein
MTTFTIQLADGQTQLSAARLVRKVGRRRVAATTRTGQVPLGCRTCQRTARIRSPEQLLGCNPICWRPDRRAATQEDSSKHSWRPLRGAMVTLPDMTHVSTKIRDVVKRIPGTQTLYFKLLGFRLPKSTEDAFRDAITGNKWGVNNDSLSGSGSDLYQTRVVRQRLLTLWSEFDVRTMLDLPCGDFYWIAHVPMDRIQYIGGDILPELIERNVELYQRPNVTFRRINLLQDRLPKVDLVLCRDCLVHFSYRDALTALGNICDSGSTYLLTTTFTDRRRNHNIATGQFRPLNLEARPFSLPVPIVTINEGCTEYNGVHRDKSLGLWRVSDIRAHLERRRRWST